MNSRTQVIIKKEVEIETIHETTPVEKKPVHTTLLIDCSGSMAGSGITNALSGAKRVLLKHALTSDKLELKVFNNVHTTIFGLKERNDIDWDDAVNKVKQCVDGQTSLYDSIYAAICEIEWHSKAQRELVVFTDGEDTCSRMSFDEIQKIISSRNPDKHVRKTLHITIIGAGISPAYATKLQGLCCSHCDYLPCGLAKNSIKHAFDTVTNSIIRRTTVTFVSRIEKSYAVPQLGAMRALPALSLMSSEHQSQLGALSNGTNRAGIPTPSKGQSSARSNNLQGKRKASHVPRGGSTSKGNTGRGMPTASGQHSSDYYPIHNSNVNSSTAKKNSKNPRGRRGGIKATTS